MSINSYYYSCISYMCEHLDWDYWNKKLRTKKLKSFGGLATWMLMLEGKV